MHTEAGISYTTSHTVIRKQAYISGAAEAGAQGAQLRTQYLAR